MNSLRFSFAARCARTHNAADEARQINGSIALAAVLLLLAVFSDSRHGQCIDYDDYPQWVGGVGMSTHTREITIDGDYAYMTGTFPPGPVVANISNPAAPEVVSFLEMGSWTFTMFKAD